MKRFQLICLTYIDKHRSSSKMLHEHVFQPDVNVLHTLLNRVCEEIDAAGNHTQLMFVEVKLTKALYKMVSQTVGYGDFTRVKRGGGTDMANRFLDRGNYLAYGLAAVAMWVTGIPHDLAVMHGKTRRGGFVFDLTDLIKDAFAMPQASIAVIAGEDAQEFCQRCVNIFQQVDALDAVIIPLQETTQALAKIDQ